MVSSFVVSIGLLVLKKQAHLELSTHHALLLTVGITTVSRAFTAFLGPHTDRAPLITFYRKVRPFGPGWQCIRNAAGISTEAAAAAHENIPLVLLGWTSGCVVIWSSLFTVGSPLYGCTTQALFLTPVCIVSGVLLLRVINNLWNNRELPSVREAQPTVAAKSRYD